MQADYIFIQHLPFPLITARSGWLWEARVMPGDLVEDVRLYPLGGRCQPARTDEAATGGNATPFLVCSDHGAGRVPGVRKRARPLAPCTTPPDCTNELTSWTNEIISEIKWCSAWLEPIPADTAALGWVALMWDCSMFSYLWWYFSL